MKRVFAIPAIIAMVFGILLAVASPGIAHTKNITSTCKQVTVDLTAYAHHSPAANTVKVTVDGAVKTDTTFDQTFNQTYTFADSFVANNYRVQVHAFDDQRFSFDTGTVSVAACPLVKNASASVSTTPPTCDTGETLVLGTAVNATWGVVTGAVGPGNYSATANANHGSAFVSGDSSKTFTGTLAGDLSLTQACHTQPADEKETRDVSTLPNCKKHTVTTKHQSRTREINVWDDVTHEYTPGPWTAWVTDSTSTRHTNVHECQTIKLPKHAHVTVHVTDKCNCFMDKVQFSGNANQTRIQVTHPNRLTWVAHVTGLKVNGKQFLLPSRINGNSGWSVHQNYTVHTTNVKCPCHKTHTCPVNGPPHHHCKTDANVCKLND